MSLTIAETVFDILKPIVPDVIGLIMRPPADHEVEERAKQIGMNVIRAASDARMRAELGDT